ncbi:RdgB/HAM1 family non-canonical purine NTP pyrophosphatase [Hugenholtzia roseola]|uniref:RdgB/HAM1 family non-canonical purine NTP pyrophosphatase n=1 Tax=Hugenholtzia roseola TaxID=1002 RepID=UPI0003F87AE9|nr:RdgB/HAM1 family non-canonical purine NTP pyrophosphatase [Hugenholtzia roseola]
MPTLYFATHNSNKVRELQQIFASHHLAHFQLKSLADLNDLQEIEETGTTFQANALLKAEHLYQRHQVEGFADDSGLEVEALGGAPGIYSARYSGKYLPNGKADDKANIAKLLEALAGLPPEKRKARFVTVIALIWQGKAYFFEGTVEGHLIEEPKGENGFGYDPIFIPFGETKTFAQMDKDKKNSLSHRAKAVQKLLAFLQTVS